MKPLHCIGPVAIAAGILVAIIPRVAEAHEKWFIDSSRYPLRWDLFGSDGSLTCACVVAMLVGALAIVWHARGRRDFIPPPESLGATAQGRRIIYALLPLVIGLHTAIALFYNGSHGVLLSPNIQLHGAAAYICGVVEIGVGLSLFYGGLTRVAALVLIALWIAGIPLAGIQSMLDNALYLGIAVFFFLAGRGPIAIDRFMFPRLEPPDALARHAVTVLRVGLGASFIVVAFTEKLANTPLALAFLHRYPLNFTAALGMPLSDRVFVLGAGSVELLIGLCLLFGLFTRETIIIAWLPINLTLTYFNTTELVGHLPIYGMMALLLIWIPGRANRDQWIEGLHLFRPSAALVDRGQAA